MKTVEINRPRWTIDVLMTIKEFNMNNLTDVVEHWLQGKVNDAVARHSSRIAYLEGFVSTLSERLDKLEKDSPEFPGLFSHVEHMSECSSELQKRVDKLEKAYPGMATTKDLLKDTRAEVLMDKLQPLIEQVIRNELEGCVKHCELEESATGGGLLVTVNLSM